MQGGSSRRVLWGGKIHTESPAHYAYHPDLAQILCERETLPRLHQSRVTELA